MQRMQDCWQETGTVSAYMSVFAMSPIFCAVATGFGQCMAIFRTVLNLEPA